MVCLFVCTGRKFESVQKGGLTFSETAEEKKRFKQTVKLFEPLTKWFKGILGPRVTKVEVSRQLADVPCAVVASQWGYSAHMERVMRTQTFADPMHMKMMKGQKVFEINPHHKLIQQLLSKVKEEAVTSKETALAEELFSAALLASGFDVETPMTLAVSVYKNLSREMGLEGDNLLNEEIELPEETDTDKETQESTDTEDADDLLAGMNLNFDSADDASANVKDEL